MLPGFLMRRNDEQEENGPDNCLRLDKSLMESACTNPG